MMILPENIIPKPRAIPATGKYRTTLVNQGKKMNSKVGNQGNREKNRRLKQMDKKIYRCY